MRKSSAPNLLSAKMTRTLSNTNKILSLDKVIDMRREAFYKATTTPSSGFIFQKKQEAIIKINERKKVTLGFNSKLTKASSIGNNLVQFDTKLTRAFKDPKNPSYIGYYTNKNEQNKRQEEVPERCRSISTCINGYPKFALFNREGKYVKIKQPERNKQKALVTIPPCEGDIIDDFEDYAEENYEYKNNNTSVTMSTKANISNKKPLEIKIDKILDVRNPNKILKLNANKPYKSSNDETNPLTTIKKKIANLPSTGISTLFGRSHHSRAVNDVGGKITKNIMMGKKLNI